MKRIVVALIAAALVLGPAPAAQAKSYRFAGVDMRINIDADGGFTVEERRTFEFEGSFSFAYITIPRGRWRVQPLGVCEVVIYAPPNPGCGPPFRRDDSRAPGTWTFTSAGEDEIRWFYSAANQEKTFHIRYKVSNQVIRYEDVAEFYWKFIGDQWDVPSDNIRISVALPGAAAADQIRVWGHGPLEGEVHPSPRADGKVQSATWAAPHLPPRTFVEGRMTFPPDLVPEAPRLQGLRLPQVLHEEQGFADAANRARTLARWWNIGAPNRRDPFAHLLLLALLPVRTGTGNN